MPGMLQSARPGPGAGKFPTEWAKKPYAPGPCMKGAFLIVALLLAGAHLPLQAEASHGGIHSFVACGEAIRPLCKTICDLNNALPFGIVRAVIDCLP